MRCGVPATSVKNVIIWGNHSSTQYPDVHHCLVNMSGSELACFDAVKDDAWLKGDFIAVSYNTFCILHGEMKSPNQIRLKLCSRCTLTQIVITQNDDKLQSYAKPKNCRSFFKNFILLFDKLKPKQST